VISGNGKSGNGHGIDVAQFVSGTTILGNYIGTDKNGVIPIGNEKEGVFITALATNTTIGGVGANDGNVISGNKRFGLSINSASTSVKNNRIGFKAGTGLTEMATLRNNITGTPRKQVDPEGDLGQWTPDNQIAPADVIPE
jgi:hypothetical protein